MMYSILEQLYLCFKFGWHWHTVLKVLRSFWRRVNQRHLYVRMKIIKTLFVHLESGLAVALTKDELFSHLQLWSYLKSSIWKILKKSQLWYFMTNMKTVWEFYLFEKMKTESFYLFPVGNCWYVFTWEIIAYNVMQRLKNFQIFGAWCVCYYSAPSETC